mgnify:CR=1 FL=1
MWKTKAIVVLETMDHNMMDIIGNGPHIPTFDETKDSVKSGVIKKTPKHLLVKKTSNYTILMFVLALQ